MPHLSEAEECDMPPVALQLGAFIAYCWLIACEVVRILATIPPIEVER